MPIPVSLTVTCAWPFAHSSASVTRPPSGVNLMAFESRFSNTWLRRAGSPRTGAGVASRPVGVDAGRGLARHDLVARALELLALGHVAADGAHASAAPVRVVDEGRDRLEPAQPAHGARLELEGREGRAGLRGGGQQV